MSQIDLFTGKADPAPIPPDVEHVRAIFRGRVDLEELVDELGLEQLTAHMGGRAIPVPRLEAWYGLKPYAFGGRVVEPKAKWPATLVELRRAVESAVGQPFDSCFANYYRSGDDTIPWHADDDKWIGPWIASVTFGAARRFDMKRKDAPEPKFSYTLGDGDLFVMRPGVQAKWLHSVPRVSTKVGPRLNLTFRQTVPT